jgi:hypothetical protein
MSLRRGRVGGLVEGLEEVRRSLVAELAVGDGWAEVLAAAHRFQMMPAVDDWNVLVEVPVEEHRFLAGSGAGGYGSLVEDPAEVGTPRYLAS